MEVGLQGFTSRKGNELILSRLVSGAFAGAFALSLHSASAAAVSIGFDVADTVTVQSVSAVLAPGGSIDVDTSSARQDPTPVDILFLSDTTGSMGDLTRAAGREANEIVARTSTLGDVAWTVASYRDFPQFPWGGFGDYPFRYDQTITADGDAIADALRSWRASGGSDRKESNLFALQSLADGGSSSFRADSDRYLLWFGDQPAHDPADTQGYPGPGLEETIAALQAVELTVLGVDVGNLDGDGELTQIVGRTGGSIGALEGNLSDLVFDSLLEVIDPRTDVTLDIILFEPDGQPGFAFGTTFFGLARGSYRLDVADAGDFSLTATDLAFDPRPGIAPIPLPAALPLLGAALAGLGLVAGGRRPRPAP